MGIFYCTLPWQAWETGSYLLNSSYHDLFVLNQDFPIFHKGTLENIHTMSVYLIKNELYKYSIFQISEFWNPSSLAQQFQLNGI